MGVIFATSYVYIIFNLKLNKARKHDKFNFNLKRILLIKRVIEKIKKYLNQ
jgi:hypothetical protein